MPPILLHIFGPLPFTPDEQQRLTGALQKITLQKKDLLLREGEAVTDLYYIHSGCLRTYFLDADGKEHTLQFAVRGWWISDYIALFGKGAAKSVSYIECIKEATLYKISKRDFDRLCADIPAVSSFHIQKLETAFAAFQQRILDNLTLSAGERYLNFVRAYPDIEQRVKNYHIASFLGITTESLSRIRKELAAV